MWGWAQSSLQDLGVDTDALSNRISNIANVVVESVAPLGAKSIHHIMLTQKREDEFIISLQNMEIMYDTIIIETTNSLVIHIASEQGCDKVIQYILSSLSNINTLDNPNPYPNIAQFDNKGQTPLHYAARKGHTTTCKLLLGARHPALVHDQEGRTPYDVATSIYVRQEVR